MGRNLGEVLGRLLDVIPERERDFRAGLDSVVESMRYCPPEAMVTMWRKANVVFNYHVPPQPAKLSDWQRRAVSVWMGEDA